MSGEEAAKAAKICVWWDMKDCPVPDGVDAHRVRPSIEGGLKEQGYSGPVSIIAYGDHKQTPEQLLRALYSTGVAVLHIRSESTCAVMYKDMVAWREDNPPPAKMMIITNQMLDVFHLELARLQQRTRYDLFLAYSVEPCAILFLDTCKEWLWEKLLLGTTAAVTSSADTADAVFCCKSCGFYLPSLKSFKKHLSSKFHAVQEEVLRPQPTELISVTSKWGKNYAATPEYATAEIHVWWDMYSCPIPDGYDARRVRPSLEGAFKELGYSGPVSIIAYGDYKRAQTPERHLHALSSTGIDVAHATRELIYRRMYEDLEKWKSENPTPATMMIISDVAVGVFGELLAFQQQEYKHNLFWAYSFRPLKMSFLLTSAEWLWDSLLAETKRHVLRKCSGSSERAVESTGMFYCQLCFSKRTLSYYKRKRPDKFIKHLSSTKHLYEEVYVTDLHRRKEIMRLQSIVDERFPIKKKKRFPESKRLKKAA